MRRIIGLWLLLLCGCDPGPRDAAAPGELPHDATAPASARSAPTASEAEAPAVPRPEQSATATSAPIASERGGGFPKLDDQCRVDADCVVFEDEIADAPPRTFTCCGGCTHHTANKNWYAKFRAACAGLSPPMCPPLGCLMAIVRPVCEAGHCVAR